MNKEQQRNNLDNIKDGIVNIYKEKGYTSHDVVAILRKKFRIKKIGHTGTLDPEAEGVLPICIGKGTKVADFITNKTKIYKTSMKLGEITNTQDHTGEILKKSDVLVSKEEIKNTILKFIGNYNQIPPMYSALKVNGKKLYELAREGKSIERKPRKVIIFDIYDINILDIENISFTVKCSKGTYIRTLCNDIGEALGCGAHMTSLIRIASGDFEVDNSFLLNELDKYINNNEVNNIIRDIDTVFKIYPKLTILSDYNKQLYNGNKLKEKYIENKFELNENNIYRIYDNIGKFIGIYECIIEEEIILKPIKVFI